jgi:hypothetical protein
MEKIDGVAGGVIESGVPAERKEEADALPVKYADVPKDALFDLGSINLPSYLEIREKVLNIEDAPDRAVVVLSLRAFGLSLPHIAKICKCAIQTVVYYTERYDPKGLCRISAEGKRMITSQMLMSGAVGAMLEITQEKLAASDASELAGIATRCVLAAEKIRELDKGNRDANDRIKNALDYLEEPQ